MSFFFWWRSRPRRKLTYSSLFSLTLLSQCYTAYPRGDPEKGVVVGSTRRRWPWRFQALLKSSNTKTEDQEDLKLTIGNLRGFGRHDKDWKFADKNESHWHKRMVNLVDIHTKKVNLTARDRQCSAEKKIMWRADYWVDKFNRDYGECHTKCRSSLTEFLQKMQN